MEYTLGTPVRDSIFDRDTTYYICHMTFQNALSVACAIIEKNGLFLAARRGRSQLHAGFWEFPGGKIGSHESAESAIVREIREELGGTVVIIRRLNHVTFAYPDKTVTLIPFVCDGSAASFRASEHEEIRWVDGTNPETLAWLPPDAEILASYQCSREIKRMASRP
jgi:8-oxo-dGTP diphosphatase